MRSNRLHANPLAPRQCVVCSGPVAPCNCSARQHCQIISQSCTQCATPRCIDPPSTSSGGISKGAMAGAVAGIIVFLLVAVFGFLFWRRRSQRAQASLRVREKGLLSTAGTSTPLDGSNLGDTMRSTSGLAGERRTSALNSPFDSPHDNALISPRSSELRASSNLFGGTASPGPARPDRPSELGDIRNTPDYLTQVMNESRKRRSQGLAPKQHSNVPYGGSDPTSDDGESLEPPRLPYEPSARSEFTTDSVESSSDSVMSAVHDIPIISVAERVRLSPSQSPNPYIGVKGPPSRLLSNGPSSARSGLGPSPLVKETSFEAIQEESFEAGESDPFTDGSIRSGTTENTFTFGTPSVQSFHHRSGSRSSHGSRRGLSHYRSAGSVNTAGQSSHSHNTSAETHNVYPPGPSALRPQPSRESYTSGVSFDALPFMDGSSPMSAADRSPRSVRRFDTESRRTSAASHATNYTTGEPGSSSRYERWSEAPPMPHDHQEIATLNYLRPQGHDEDQDNADEFEEQEVSLRGSRPVRDPLQSPTTTMRSNVGSVFPGTPRVPPSRMTAGSSIGLLAGGGVHGYESNPTMDRLSRASAASSGLGAFDFHFATPEDAPAVPSIPAQLQRSPSAVSSAARFSANPPPPSMSLPPSRAPPLPIPHRLGATGSPQRFDPESGSSISGERASLDVMGISRDLTAHQIPY